MIFASNKKIHWLDIKGYLINSFAAEVAFKNIFV